MSADSTEFISQLRHRLQNDPLWEFALQFYARPGIEQACLQLQDAHGWDVCELLWRCWLYRHGIEAGDFPTEARDWQREVTYPLRSLRRQLKAAARACEGVASVRSRVSEAELAAERETLHILMKISLDGNRLEPLSRPLPRLEKVLYAEGEIQEKSQVGTVRHIESQLDPL
ncbi:TIGR02444 family protein [Halomonas cupida]|uniref:TIGR02444 family protein n=1 Tax=Halomonas cupida TaxID=44933 RepID=UPI0039B5FA45